jgi:hypothetical protein
MKEIKALKVSDIVIHAFSNKRFTVTKMDEFHICFWLKPMNEPEFMVTTANMLCVFEKENK